MDKCTPPPPPPPEKKALLGTGQMYLFACVNEFLSIYIVKKMKNSLSFFIVLRTVVAKNLYNFTILLSLLLKLKSLLFLCRYIIKTS